MDCPHNRRHFLSSRRGLFEGLRTDAAEVTCSSLIKTVMWFLELRTSAVRSQQTIRVDGVLHCETNTFRHLPTAAPIQQVTVPYQIPQTSKLYLLAQQSALLPNPDETMRDSSPA